MVEAIQSNIVLVLGLPFLACLLQLGGYLFENALGFSCSKAMRTSEMRWMMGAMATISIFISFGVGVYILFQLLELPEMSRSISVHLWDWIDIADTRFPFELLIDPLSITMTLIITGIGGLIFLYSTGYMSKDPELIRFFMYLCLFIGMMLILVFGNNLVLTFMGWEGVGLCSYLLIGFWYKDLKNVKAAQKAFVMNRIGDYGMMLGMFLLATLLITNREAFQIADPRWLSYDILIPNLQGVAKSQPALTTAVAVLLFVGAVGKSAQLPLYTWLPDAMAGPTPVSALIHAATMVTAGVFLLNRLHILFELSPLASAIVALTGALTAIFAALVAFGQTDIKKVLAYSTVSQLGYMFMACGVGFYWVGLFHVVTHAFFKALLFLGSGAVIYAMNHEQDMRRYGNLWKYLPITGATMIIGWLSIAGLPLLSGFWSKEAILSGAFGSMFPNVYLNDFPVTDIIAWTGVLVAVLTAAYMTRMMLLTFGVPFIKGKERWRDPVPAEYISHEPVCEWVPALYPESDPNRFYLTDAELDSEKSSIFVEHSHALTKAHEPREVPVSMSLPLVLLGILSAVGGYWLHQAHRLRDFLWISSINADSGLESSYPWDNAVLDPKLLFGGHFHGGRILLFLSVGAALLGLGYGFWIYLKGLPDREDWDLSRWSPFRRAAKNQFGYDNAITYMTANLGGKLSNLMYKFFDTVILDGFVNSIGYVCLALGGVFRKLQTGYLRFYALIMLGGVLALLGYFMYMFIGESDGACLSFLNVLGGDRR